MMCCILQSGTIAIKKAFTKMVKEKCLIAVRPSDSLTAADRDMVEEKRETDKLSMPPTAAQKAEIRRTIESKRAGLEGGNHIVGLVRDHYWLTFFCCYRSNGHRGAGLLIHCPFVSSSFYVIETHAGHSR